MTRTPRPFHTDAEMMIDTLAAFFALLIDRWNGLYPDDDPMGRDE